MEMKCICKGSVAMARLEEHRLKCVCKGSGFEKIVRFSMNLENLVFPNPQSLIPSYQSLISSH